MYLHVVRVNNGPMQMRFRGDEICVPLSRNLTTGPLKEKKTMKNVSLNTVAVIGLGDYIWGFTCIALLVNLYI